MHLIYLMVKGSSEKFQVYSVAVFHTEEFSLCTFRRSPSSLQVLLNDGCSHCHYSLQGPGLS